jgi:Acetyltransferase (GNAT) domain
VSWSGVSASGIPRAGPGFELGWMLRRSFWGRGYATEGARGTQVCLHPARAVAGHQPDSPGERRFDSRGRKAGGAPAPFHRCDGKACVGVPDYPRGVGGAEPTDQVDRAGITAFRDVTMLQPARQLIFVVRRLCTHPVLPSLIVGSRLRKHDRTRGVRRFVRLAG